MPRLGMGMPIVSDVSSAPVVAIDDFVFLNDVSGELTPNSTAVRKNLLVQSQTFKTTWTTSNAAIPNDLFKAPDDSLTAQAITATSSGASNVYAQQVVATTAGETYTYSAHVKAGANGFVLLLFFDGSTSRIAYFNADTGSVGSPGNIISTHFQKLDDDWRRVSITFQADSTTSSSFVRIYSAAASGSTATGAAFDAGTELLYIWGAQLEEDSRPSNYMVTTNAAVTVAAIFGDVSEVFDFDGTDIMLEASLSKDEGAFDRASGELVTNGGFAVDANWTKGANWSIANGKANYAASGFSNFTQVPGFDVGSTYEVTVTIAGTGSNICRLFLGQSNGTPHVLQNGANTIIAVAEGDRITLRNLSQSAFTIDNVTAKEYAITPKSV